MGTIPPTLEIVSTEYLPLCGELSLCRPGKANVSIPFPVPSTLSVGRSPESDIHLDTLSASYRHGRFVSSVGQDGNWSIVYENTSDDCYTYSNQEKLPVSPYPLTTSVTLRFGWGKESTNIIFTPFTPTSLRSRFNIKELCGDGRAGDVYIVEERQERLRKFGAKVVILSAFERRKGIQDPCAMEHSLQTQCKHSHVIEMRDIIFEPHRTILITELAIGDLADRLTTPFPIRLAKSILAQLASGLSHIHSRGIIHRDLRPANVLLTSYDPVIAKIGDFGSATDSVSASGLHGRPQFSAPEVLQGVRYGKSVDVWSLGVIMFLMLSGEMPFLETDLIVGANGLATEDGRDNPRFFTTDAISLSGKALIRSMLDKSSSKRVTSARVSKHPYLRGALSWKIAGTW